MRSRCHDPEVPVNTSTRKALLLATLLILVPAPRAFSQETPPIGTLTIAEVSATPVQVFSASLNYTHSALPGTGGGAAGQSQPIFSSFLLAKLVDGTSPSFLVNAASGRLFPQARIDLFGPDGLTILT